MSILSISKTGLTFLIGVQHVYIMALEMFLWTKPRGRKAFKLTPDFANKTKSLAANQGLYNGFLAAGLAWGAFHPVPAFRDELRIFFLGCVVVAGLFGGITVGRKILLIQGLPAALVLGAVWYL
ncbi:integral membrane protein [Podospora fimiseda]|uniref:Integral membrane protein n=1 Tax=Podospora fimiseda TaxID=252190 RepID=A0AAN7BHK1_9PEZI|nr:integral membrane protein [Podospora fimiseda]